MKLPPIFLLIFLLATPAFAQQDPYLRFAKAFSDNYNNQTFGDILDLTNDAFKAQVTREQITQILSAAFSNAGKVKEIKLEDSTANRRIYDLICERGAFALTVALDDSGKAGGLFIRPLDQAKTSQEAIEKWKAN